MNFSVLAKVFGPKGHRLISDHPPGDVPRFPFRVPRLP
jgi:hypothetical protein